VDPARADVVPVDGHLGDPGAETAGDEEQFGIEPGRDGRASGVPPARPEGAQLVADRPCHRRAQGLEPALRVGDVADVDDQAAHDHEAGRHQPADRRCALAAVARADHDVVSLGQLRPELLDLLDRRRLVHVGEEDVAAGGAAYAGDDRAGLAAVWLGQQAKLRVARRKRPNQVAAGVDRAVVDDQDLDDVVGALGVGGDVGEAPSP